MSHLSPKYLWMLGAAICLAVGVTTATLYAPSVSPPASPTAAIRQSAMPNPGAKLLPHDSEGLVEGPISYPGEAVPPDLRVCAVSVGGGEPRCVGQIGDPRFPGGRGYRIGLPAGTYFIYAVSPSFDPAYRAYYSEFVRCGKAYGCAEHTPVQLKVTAGSVTSGIEPGDFYR